MVIRNLDEKSGVVDAIRMVANQLGRAPSRSEFRSRATMTEYQILRHFPSWREALRAAGFEADPTNIRLEDEVLLKDWADFVRRYRHIPTRNQYKREGKFSPGVFDRHFGPWSGIPSKFRVFAEGNADWADVIALLPVPIERRGVAIEAPLAKSVPRSTISGEIRKYARLDGVPTYGNPLDFRGLRHEPVNEQGVVFLFGMVARELGYMVEAVQTGYPDCDAKRQIGPGKWQRVRIEFEYESRNFRDHGHPVEGCDVIVCWRHNWPEYPQQLEILELQTVIKTLAATEDS